jgi:uncharacterized damage-inducible protein DinB
MKELFVINAKYNQAADRAILSILNGLSNDDREQGRGSYYNSLSGLVRHIAGGTGFFLGMFREAIASNPAALAVIGSLKPISPPGGSLTEAQWQQLAADIAALDEAYVNFTAALTEEDLKAPVKNNKGGGPATVPLCFRLDQMMAHGTHHRGQVSQILDSLGIDNDYSGIDTAFLPA